MLNFFLLYFTKIKDSWIPVDARSLSGLSKLRQLRIATPIVLHYVQILIVLFLFFFIRLKPNACKSGCSEPR